MNQWAKLGQVRDPVPTASTPQTDEDKSKTEIGAILLLWYSSDVRTAFKNEKEKADWMRQRLVIAQQLHNAKLQYGESLNESWRTFMSACHVLNLPQTKLPE